MKFSNLLLATLVTTSFLSSTVFAANIGVANNTVNIRESASTSSNIVGTYNIGEEFEISGISDNFYTTIKNGKTYYVFTDFADVKKADATIKGDGVFIRNSASMDGEVLEILALNTPVTVVGKTGDWYQIQDGTKLGYVHKDFVQGQYINKVGEPIAKATVSATTKVSTSTNYQINASGGLNLRASASETANVITVIPNGSVITGLSNLDGFTKVTYNGNTGYVSSAYISETSAEPTAIVATSTGSVGTQITDWAKQYIGTPYSYGGTNLSSGVDCSGFVYSVFNQNPYYNVTLNRVASDQYNNGTKVSRSDLVAGDLIFFDTSGSNDGQITHSGIYMGGGQFIHSSSGSAYSVTVSELNSGYYTSRFVGASRVIN